MSAVPNPPIGRRGILLAAASAALGGAVFGGLGAVLGMRRADRKRRKQNFKYRIADDCAALNNVGKTRTQRVRQERETKKRKLLANPGIISHTGFSEDFIRKRFQLFDCADGIQAVLLKPGAPLVLSSDCRLFIKGRFAVCCDVIVKEGAQLGFEQLYTIRSFRGSTFDPATIALFAGESARWLRGNVVKNDNSCLEFGAMPAFETEKVQQDTGQLRNLRFNTVPLFGCCGVTTLIQGGLVITHWQPEVDGVECWTGGLIMHPVMQDCAERSTQTTTAPLTALPLTSLPLATVTEVESDSEQGEDAAVRDAPALPSSPFSSASTPDSASPSRNESDTASGSSLTPTTATSEDMQSSDTEEASADRALDQMTFQADERADEQAMGHADERTSPHEPSTPPAPSTPLASDTDHTNGSDALVPLMSVE